MAESQFSLNFLSIPTIPKMIKDYLSGGLSNLHSPLFSKENALYQAAIKAENYSLHHRKVLSEVLGEQMQSLPLSELQKENLQNLQQKNTFTVVTGHQLNLFTGPAYFIYKILQVVKTTNFLNQNSENKKFVPLFWMASEDHDFEEINHFKTTNHYYFTNEKSGDAVGRIEISDNKFINDFIKEFEDCVFGTELIRWIQEAYANGNTFSKATQLLVNRIFGEYGLLILDADDRRLKTLVQPVFEKELLQEHLYQSTHETVEQLREKYGKVQVNPREINLFYFNEGKRNRIEKEGNHFAIVDTEIKFSKEELLRELRDFPERFSPNAVLRPVYQETILPNILYIGGNAEIMYWLELKKGFDGLNLPFPILLPRNSFAMISKKNFDKMKKLGLKVEDFFGNYEETVHRKLLENTPLDPFLNEKEQEVISIFEALEEKAKLTDKTFENLVSAEKKRQLKSYKKMKKRLLRAEKIVQGDLYQRFNLLYEEINPGGIWQERTLNFSEFYADEGKDWIANCYQNTQIEKPQLAILII